MPAETRNPRITYNPDQCGGRPCIATSASPSCTTAPFIDRSVASATASCGRPSCGHARAGRRRGVDCGTAEHGGISRKLRRRGAGAGPGTDATSDTGAGHVFIGIGSKLFNKKIHKRSNSWLCNICLDVKGMRGKSFIVAKPLQERHQFAPANKWARAMFCHSKNPSTHHCKLIKGHRVV